MDAWHAQRQDRRAEAYSQAVLARTDRKLPSMKDWLDPPRTKRLTPEQSEQARREFEAAKAISDRVPVRLSRAASKDGDRDQHTDGQTDPPEQDHSEYRDGEGDGQ